MYYRIPVVSDSSGGVVCAGLHAMYRSTDDGITWNTISTFEGEISALAVGADGRLVTSVEWSMQARRIRVSTDFGATWSEAILNDSTTIYSLGATADGKLYAGTWGKRLFRSEDGGATWMEVSIDGVSTYYSFAAPSDGSIVVATGRGVYRSGDGGNNWQLVGNDDSRLTIPVLELASDGKILAGTYNSGIYVAGNDRWNPSSRGLPPLGAGSVAVAPDQTVYTVSTNSRLYASTDKGTSWVEPDNSEVYTPVITVDREGTLYAATGYYKSGVSRSTDRGRTWTLGNTGIEEEWILALQPGRQGRLYAAVERGAYVYHYSETDGLFMSTDRGDSWVALGTGLRGTSPVAVVELGDGTLFVGSQYEEKMVMRLNPGDTLWQDVSAGLPMPAGKGYATLHALIADNAGSLYAGTHHGLYKSSDRGQSWQRTGLEIPDTSVTALALSPGGRILAATILHGVYASDDNGTSWKHLGDARGVTGFDMLAVDSLGGIFAGNRATGLYRAAGASSVPVTSGSINAGLAAHPNPTGSLTTVEFTMTSTGTTRLVLYTSSGEQVAVVAEGERNQGSYRIELDLSGYPSGNYLLRLETARGSEQMGVMVVR
jgi:ligand-binding sensor domain-containing protein